MRNIAAIIISVGVFILALIGTIFAGIAAAIWNPIDQTVIAKADDAGWDASMLLPHENLLWITINGSFIVFVLATAAALANLVFAIQRGKKLAPRPRNVSKQGLSGHDFRNINDKSGLAAGNADID